MFSRVALLSLAAFASLPFASAQSSSSNSRRPASSAPSGPVGPVTADLTRLTITPSTLDFGPVASGDQRSLGLTLRNDGSVALDLRRIKFLLGPSGDSSDFTLTLASKSYAGSTADVTRVPSPRPVLAPGETLAAILSFEPSSEELDAFTLRFETFDEVGDVSVTGLGGHSGDPFLHVTIDGPDWLVDYDEDGAEPLLFDGTGSHTHEPGHTLSGYSWKLDGQVVATGPTLAATLASANAIVELEISDDNVPAHTLSGQKDVELVAPDQVPGALAFYHDASASGPDALLDAPPSSADFVEPRADMSVSGTGQVGGSPFSQNVLVRLFARVNLPSSGWYTFSQVGGSARKLFLEGDELTMPIFVAAPGEYELEARFAVETLADLPLDVLLAEGGAPASLETERLRHDETAVVPVIHTLTEVGAISGGDPITLEGFGFFPDEQVVVHWGTQDLIAADFTHLSPARIEFLSPPGGGAVAVSVSNAQGVSNVRTFLYQLEGPPPVQFRRDLILSVTQPTAGAWGPDGRLYVASLDGQVRAFTFDENYELVASATYAGVSALSNHETLSLAVNPYDPPTPVKLYVGHGDHFLHGGAPPSGPSPYTGQVSVLTGPDFDAPAPLITGLPVSNHDHAINGLAFDSNGDLLISVGSMTNAGVQATNSGDLPESPLSAAILKARLSAPGFNGTVTYVETASGLPNADQRDGEVVDVAAGVDVEVHANGLRNAFGLVYTTLGRLYATDNGPNVGFGAASTGPTTQSSTDPFDSDELVLVEWGNYYGSPNRSRGRTDPRQYTYYASLSGPPSIADTFTQMAGWLPPSSDGIDEYRANTFQGQIRGQLIVQEYQNKLRRVRLRSDGRATIGQNQIDPNTVALGCLTAPGGALVALDYEHHEVEILEPDDLTPLELVVHDIFPWRAPASGGTPFVLSGRGLGTLGTTSVTIGGQPATLTEVTWGRIRGLVPGTANPTTGLLDVVVNVGGNETTLSAAFRYLLGPGAEPGRWESLANVPSSIGEVAAAVLGGNLYVVGEGSAATFAYDALNRQWLSNKASRSFVGHHHAAEVVDGKLYLVGGLAGGSEGTLQIYDPATNSWSLGASLPWNAGSLSTATIDGKIYAAGGITTGGFTVGNCAVYDPTTDVWTALANMPDGGRNHAASGTDGVKLYVFGGRRGGNFVTNGYDSVMVYDPVADTWDWSGAAGSTLAPLPEARGGMGKAIYFRGEFYIFGGETLDDPDADANGVYDRVDVYRPLANTWRLEAPMPNPRHGIHPVLFQGHVFLPAGGTQSANSQSNLFDAFTRQ